MTKALTLHNLYKKKFKTMPFDGIYKEVFGTPTIGGLWLIYGAEKHGKTWGALLLAEYLSRFEKVLYVSAEQGIDKEFQDAIKRANLTADNKRLHFLEYEPIEEVKVLLKRRRAPKIAVLDNLTIYNEELRAKGVKELMQEFSNVTFLCVAHMERNKPYTATAMMASKLAKVLIRVEGLTMTVGGRVPGGILTIDEEKAALYHGQKITE